MASNTSLITVPDFNFSGFYYAEILEDLIAWVRVNVPEITDEDPAEPFIQLLRAFALTSHLNNVLLDLVAKERFITTATLRSSIRAQLALIDYKLKQATPAQADIIVKLSQAFATAMTPLYAAGATVATQQSSDTPAIPYQTLANKNTQRTDRVFAVYAFDASGLAFTDHTAAAQGGVGSPFTPSWAGGAAPGDLLYIGHPDIMWDDIRFIISQAATGGALLGVWEYFDGKSNTGNPDLVTNGGSNITAIVNSLLGTFNRAGAVVRITCNKTGAFEDVVSLNDGTNNYITTVGILAQAAISTSVADYTISADWQELPSIADGTASAPQGGTTFFKLGSWDVTCNLPQDVTRDWQPQTVNGLAAFWIRFRVVSNSTTVVPKFTSINITSGKQYAIVSATQGTSQADSPLASSTGLKSQAYDFSQSPVIDDANLAIFVIESSVEAKWSRVDDFLSSGPTDTHHTIDFDDDGIATATFGDGVNGKIPQAGVNNIRSTYRTMDDLNGNMGQNTITVNKSGFPYATLVYNPRAATGFVEREGSTPEDIARLRIAGPATLRTRNRALTTQDVEELTLAFTDAGGSEPFARALAIEESFGPKTVECVVVGQGGNGATTTQLQELEDYFNGNAVTDGVLVQNNELVATNYTPHPISIIATVPGGNLTAIQNALAALLNPTAKLSDGATFRWNFGDTIPLAIISAAIVDATPGTRNVTGLLLNGVAGDVALALRELPAAGAFNITVT